MKEFADDNFELDENGRKFSKWVENIVENGEIDCNGNFLFSYRILCFQKTYTADT